MGAYRSITALIAVILASAALAPTALASPADGFRPAPVRNSSAPTVAPAPSSDDGFDWGSAALGAAGALGLVLVPLAAGFAVRHGTVPPPLRP